MTLGSSRLGGTSKEYREKLERHVHLLLLWVADSDGRLKEAELEFASNQFPVAGEARTRELLDIVRNGEPRPIEQAIRMLSDESRDLRMAFMDLAITMAMADRKIAVTENHILRFYADALNLGEHILERRFRMISGFELDEPAEPVTPEMWDEEDDAGALPSDTGMTQDQARALLGVRLGATGDEIER
uniref:hypothetical protein n=1 Tax=Phenylobacterium sp. TaxID=1871053 RepID=UPI0026169706